MEPGVPPRPITAPYTDIKTSKSVPFYGTQALTPYEYASPQVPMSTVFLSHQWKRKFLKRKRNVCASMQHSFQIMKTT